MAASREVVAAGIIIFRRIRSNIEYLLLQTSYGEHHWSPPKGHVDPGESEFDTALRETEEEAGYASNDFTLLDDFEKTLKYEVNGAPKRVVYWLSQLKDPDSPVKLSHEHQDFKWLELEPALKYAKFADMQETLKQADQFIKTKS